MQEVQCPNNYHVETASAEYHEHYWNKLGAKNDCITKTSFSLKTTFNESEFYLEIKFLLSTKCDLLAPFYYNGNHFFSFLRESFSHFLEGAHKSKPSQY